MKFTRISHIVFFFALAFVVLFVVSLVSASTCYTYTDESTCEANSCSWHPGEGSGSGWCEQLGCWTGDEKNQTYCETTLAGEIGKSCTWTTKANDPWCWSNKGCCEEQGCWNGDTNYSSCLSINTTLGGSCSWQNSSGWEYCGGTAGCCNTLWCDQVGSNETLCTQLANDYYMSCSFNDSGTEVCEDMGAGYYGGYNDCTSGGSGDWNGTGCTSAEYDGFAHCWSFDNKPGICGNVSGCIYCGSNTNLTDPYDNSTGNFINSSTVNETSFCYQKPIGFCEGHQSDAGVNNFGVEPAEFTDGLLNQTSLGCGDILVKQACQFGPLPNCKWGNATSNVGTYCNVGTLSDAEKQALKPKLGGTTVTKCEDATNSLDCGNLTNNFLMPCIWNNKSTTVTYDDECTFSWNSTGFGDAKGEGDFYDIQDQGICVMAGGSWVVEKICGTGVTADSESSTSAINSFTFCEPKVGSDAEDCDDACWACGNQTVCESSKLGFCEWDTTASTCGKVSEFIGGGDCSSSCDACNFIQFWNNGTALAGLDAKQSACSDSPKGCSWLVDPYNTSIGSCFQKGKTGCSTDCWNCYNNDSCSQSSAGCTWEQETTGSSFCKPLGYSSNQEICFDGEDNDKDTMVDCADTECFGDSYCGGYVTGGCWGVADQSTCENTDSPIPGLKCIWEKDHWQYTATCKDPSFVCWRADNNETACTDGQSLNISAGACNWVNASETSGFNVWCSVNNTLADGCFNLQNETSCSSTGNCTWSNSSFGGGIGGHCEFAPYSTCYQISNQSGCNSNAGCIWNTFHGFEGESSDTSGYCDIACYNSSLEGDIEACNSHVSGLCEAQETWCEPAFSTFGGSNGCWNNDGNYSACIAKNVTCNWYNDTNSANNITGTCANNCGYCDSKYDVTVFDGMGKGHAVILMSDDAEENVPDVVDIVEFGIDDSIGSGVAMVVRLQSMNSSVCYDRYVPSLGNVSTGNGTVKVFIYMDVDGNSGNGCTGSAPSGETDQTGFEFLFEAIATYDNDTDKAEKTKKLYSCEGSSWQATNTPLYSENSLACGEKEGVVVAIQDEDLEKFPKFDVTKDIRFYVTSANGSGTRTNPVDEASGAVYTPGTIDFTFEDCLGPPGTDADADGLSVENDPDCSDFKQYGYIPSEDCYDGSDNNGDGLADCADPQCYYDLKCAGSTSYNISNDTTAPKVTFLEVKKFTTGVTVLLEVNKPSNGTLLFYEDDSTCKTLNATVYDVGTYNSIHAITSGINEYKLQHTFPLDNFSFNPQALGYELVNGTKYYYKTRICGLNDKCATSACLNFKTSKSSAFADCPKCNPIMAFAFNAPSGAAITDPFGNLDFFIKGAEDSDYSEVPDFCGLQLDWSNLTNADWQFYNKNSTKNWSITIGNASLANLADSDKTINGSALTLTTSNSVDYVGMSKSQWKILEKTAPKYITIITPKGEVGCSELWKCDNSVTSCVNLTGKTGVSLKSESSTGCEWQVPGDTGFSVYGGANVDSGSGDTGTASPSGGGGGGSGGGAVAKTYVVSDVQFSTGYTKALAINDSLRVSIDSAHHYVKLLGSSNSHARVQVRSDPQEKTISIGDSQLFEVTGDGFYDLAVHTVSANATHASVRVVKAHEAVPSDAAERDSITEDGEDIAEQSEDSIGEVLSRDGGSLWWVWVLVLFVVIVGVGWYILQYQKQKREWWK